MTSSILCFDGAMGTRLQALGLPTGECPELWNLTQPDKITQIHREYVDAGADILETHTFGAHPSKLAEYGLADQASEICKAAVQNAKRAAAGPHTKVAGALGPTGRLIEPLGDLSFDEAYQGYFEAVSALAAAGADFILFETFIDLQEMRAALLGAKSACKLPIFCQMTFEENGRTVTGTNPGTATIVLDALGASVIGANCSLGPAQLVETVRELRAHTDKPISVQPNAGLPILQNGQTIFPMNPEEMAHFVPALVEAGAHYIGGCCGTTPTHISAMKDAAKGLSIIPAEKPKGLWLTSRSRALPLGKGFPPRLIGERINPTGRKALAQSLRDGDLLPLKREALQQIEDGAELLDVNLGVPGLDTVALMTQVITELSSLTDVPLLIDTTDPATLEAGLKAYPGRALINSVSAEPDRIKEFLPLAKRYGAAVLCLPLSEDGIPATPEDRLKTAEVIRNAALQAGLTDQDLALDPLVLPVATDKDAINITLNTLKLYRTTLAFPTIMGLSNSSFGLPNRPELNASLLPLALMAGLDAPLANPCDPAFSNAWKSAQVLLGYDTQGLLWSQEAQKRQLQNQPEAESTHSNDPLERLRKSIHQGEKEGVLSHLEVALQAGIDPMFIAEEGLTAAMSEVGKDFGAGRCFLPQVLLSAETLKIAFDALKSKLPKETAKKGKCILATVRGDIHDLGKNIVGALLENSGFEVCDLGKDVSPEQILQAIKEEKPLFIGLCALMTTTLPALDETVLTLTREGYRGPIMAGGAVLTAEYAENLGIHHAMDALAALNLAQIWAKAKEDSSLDSFN